jgi:transcriptional regulator with XRE-family HTH domain
VYVYEKKKGLLRKHWQNLYVVTKTSVSKWETGTTILDIQTLPVLAAFFDVSVDDLLGYEAQLSQQQTRYYYHKLAQEFAERDFESVWEESMELVKKYYCCYSLLMQMAIQGYDSKIME